MMQTQSAAAVIARADSCDARHGAWARLTPIPTGFEPLDGVLGGGLRAEDLVLVGGCPGVGKTVSTLQWARNVAMAGHDARYVCYEHGADTLVARLLALELGNVAHPEDVPLLDGLRAALREVAFGARPLADVIETHPRVADAYAVFETYADRVQLCRGSSDVDLAALAQIANGHADPPPVLFVDYLQKIPLGGPELAESERVTRIASGLKELALAAQVPVVAVVAADRDGLTARRLRIHHFRGSTALAHEADVVITLNEKWSAVSKTHLAFDSVRARSYRQDVVFSVEKNRDGPALVDLEFRKDFPNFRFEPRGRFVSEQLVDDVLYDE
jgi:replicative DNA helicase